MRLGIIGTGLIVHEVLPMIHTIRPEKIYLLGTLHSAEKTKNLCEQYHLDGYFFDYQELLLTDVDTVYIALPNTLHYAFAKEALLHGKHVILEKPITVTSAQLTELAALARKQRRILVEAMSLHYTPAYRSIAKQLPALGDIRLVSFQFCQYSSRYDAFQEGRIAPAFDPACAGGALMDLNIYNLHAILGLFGTPQAFRYFPNLDRGIDTSGILTLTYQGSAYGSFQAAAIAAKDCQAPVSSTIQGTRGCIRISVPMNQIESYELIDNQKHSATFDFHEGKHRLSYEFQEFRRMIEEQDFAAADQMLSISLKAVQILEASRPYTVGED